MKYLPPVKKSGGFFRIGLVIVVLFMGYVLLGNSTNSENLPQFVRDKARVEVIRYADYVAGERARVIMIRDEQDNRMVMTFVKLPLFDRWNMTGYKTVPGKETKPIAIAIDDGFDVLQSEVSFDRVRILSQNGWSGSYAKTLSVLMFLLLAIGINWWLSRYRRNKVV
jgi:hypothetical protein